MLEKQDFVLPKSYAVSNEDNKNRSSQSLRGDHEIKTVTLLQYQQRKLLSVHRQHIQNLFRSWWQRYTGNCQLSGQFLL